MPPLGFGWSVDPPQAVVPAPMAKARSVARSSRTMRREYACALERIRPPRAVHNSSLAFACMPNPLAALRDLRGPLGVLASMLFVSQLGIGVMLPIIPLYAISLGASPRELGLLTTAFSLANVAAQLAIGFILDRIDPRIPVRVGIATYAGANFLISTATSVPSLLAFRALAGLGGGANLVADRVYLSRIADPARLAYLNGLLGSAASSGALMGPAIGGLLAQVADLRAPFLVVAATSSIAFLASLRLPPASRPAAAVGGIVASAFNRSVI